MLDGRYPSAEFAELRPRIVWDRVAGHDPPRARAPASWRSRTPGRSPTAASTASSCPTAGASASSTRRWSTRRGPGQTFLLGASTWRIEEIGRDRVIVTPAPGRAGRGAVLEGRRRRPPEGARRRDRRVRARRRSTARRAELEARLRPRRARRRATSSTTCASSRTPRASSRATARSSSSASATRSATGGCASSRRSAAASTPPGALALSRAPPRRARPRVRRDLVGRRDHRPPPRRRRAAGRRHSSCSSPTRSRTWSSRELGSSALFGARFRENAGARAADPARLPGPAHAALAAAAEGAVAARGRQALRATSRSSSRPTASACATCSTCPALQRAAARSCTRASCRSSRSRRRRASPFASSLLFDYVATYMYEGDTPNAERRAAALSLDRDLLRELLGQEELRDLIDPGALDEVEDDLQHRVRAHARRRSRDALGDSCAALGDLTAAEAQERVPPGLDAAAMLDDAATRAPRRPGARRRRGALDRRRGRRPLPRRARRRPARRACPTRSSRRPTRRWRRCCAATPAPTGRSRPTRSARRYGVDVVEPRSRRSSAPATSCAASCVRPGGARARVVRPRRAAPHPPRDPRRPAQGGRGRSTARALATFLPGWQGVDRHPPGGRRHRPPARGARAAAGPRAARRGLGARRAAAPPRRLLARPGSTS